ncbi:hypothetical protein FAEPRAA2165_00173 [Faecalibacterium duncaniae]|uniref:Uncharacterized protein n=1 Tax=Faecalibacterium duncaniae (strain DSM 17677 / JCM 31915 / A2-165) TaxID=411483 RepID=C7H1N4_FAED2|nr:hypothetical protein FAEPRAA2165_00173 [Faecalibacterium duncaniae]
MLLLYTARLFRQCRKLPNMPRICGRICYTLYVYAMLFVYIRILCS